MIGIEDASEEELRRLAAAYLRLAGAEGAAGSSVATTGAGPFDQTAKE